MGSIVCGPSKNIQKEHAVRKYRLTTAGGPSKNTEIGFLFHTLYFCFIPQLSISYLKFLFHTIVIFSYPRHYFHTLACIFISSTFHIFGSISYPNYSISHCLIVFSYHRNCNFIPLEVGFIPGTNLLIVRDGGRHKWHTRTPANRNLVPKFANSFASVMISRAFSVFF